MPTANLRSRRVAVENSVNYDPITEEVVLQALELVISPAASPLMIMCNLGRHRTGTVVGICQFHVPPGPFKWPDTSGLVVALNFADRFASLVIALGRR